jgi:hypothetical protein
MQRAREGGRGSTGRVDLRGGYGCEPQMSHSARITKKGNPLSSRIPFRYCAGED